MTTTSFKMSPEERYSAICLSFIFSLRMLGVFLILPVFSVYAQHLPSGNNMTLVGLAIGAYGFTQMFLQIAYGIASDKFGRRPVIIIGLLIFFIGSIVAAFSQDIHGIIIGRAIQGAGAISAAVTALAADLTRPEHLTKTMAMIGSSIGLVFAISMVAAPPLYASIGMPGIFFLTGVLALFGLFVVERLIPEVPREHHAPTWEKFVEVLKHPQLQRLNLGVFVLHFCQTAMWVLLPTALTQLGGLPTGEQWKVYLPTVLLSFVVLVPSVIAAEKHGKMKAVFLAAIALLLFVQIGFAYLSSGILTLALFLFLFFAGFNILEATQPSLIARICNPAMKGAALGIYNTTQSLGLFAGGAVGGIVTSQFGAHSVWLICGTLITVWLIIATGMRTPASRNSHKSL